MFMNNNDNAALFCSCGCPGVVLRVDKDKDTADCELVLVSDMYYTVQETWWDRFKGKCKRIMKILRNEEHEYFNIYIEAEEMKEFKDFVAKI